MGKVSFPIPPEMKKEIEEAKKEGKEIRFMLPRGGAPVYFSDDLIEKLRAEARKEKRRKETLDKALGDDNAKLD